jgi:VRR-NUC domain
MHRGARPKGWTVERAAQSSLLNTLGPDWQGMHAENSLCLTLFALICWDSINAAATTAANTISNSGSSGTDSSVYSRYRIAAPELWQTVTQLSPQVESICKQVEAGGAPLLIRRAWSQHYGELCTGLNWNLLSGRQQYQQLQQQQQQQGDDESDSTTAATATSTDSDVVVDAAGAEPFCAIAECIGPRVLGAIVRTLAGNYWAWRHGLPDLFLWRHSISDNNDNTTSSSVSTDNSNSNGSSSSNGNSGISNVYNISSNRGSDASQCVFAEVKGPGDSLSHAQSAWIDKLLAAGATVELVKVEKAAGAFVQPTVSDVQMDYVDDAAATVYDEDEVDNAELD